MKVLMLAKRFHPHVGGVEKHLLEVSADLTKRGHEITIVTERYEAELPEREEIALPDASVLVIRIPHERAAGSNMSGSVCWSAMNKLKALVPRVDIVHCHDFSVFISWYLPFRFLFPSKPVFVTFHGWEGVCPPRPWIVLLRKITTALTRGNICIGDFISKWYGTKADNVTYGGVNMPVDDPPEVDKNAAVFIGRLDSDTGILMYLRALTRLAEKGITLALTVCGDGPLRYLSESLARENNLDVTFTGFIEHPELFLRNARYSFVSGYLGILEALSHKKVVFSVYDSPLKEDYLRLIPNSQNIMFIAGTSEELAAQLELCENDKSIADIKAAGGLAWTRQQSWEKVADMYENLWGIHK